MAESYLWPIVLLSGLGTFLIRLSFLMLLDKFTLPKAFMDMLRFIPVSVLPALIVPTILLHKAGGTITYAGVDRTVAALVAVAVAVKTRNVLATIGSGMVVLWIFDALV